jgi:hypothetical protein
MRRRSPPMFDMAGKLAKNVVIVCLRLRLLLKKKNNFTILKDLMIVVCGPKELFVVELMIIPKIVKMTIIMSKMFQESKKKRFPYPAIFIKNSTRKRNVKIILMLSKVLVKCAGYPYHWSDRMMVLTNMQMIMKT